MLHVGLGWSMVRPCLAGHFEALGLGRVLTIAPRPQSWPPPSLGWPATGRRSRCCPRAPSVVILQGSVWEYRVCRPPKPGALLWAKAVAIQEGPGGPDLVFLCPMVGKNADHASAPFKGMWVRIDRAIIAPVGRVPRVARKVAPLLQWRSSGWARSSGG